MLEFDEAKHEYRYDGEVVPSVTQILRFMSVDIAAGANPYMRQVAAERGRRIHEACVAYDIGGIAGISDEDADIIPYIKAYKTFLDDYQIDGWELYERPLYHSFCKFAGTIDRYGSIDGMPTVLDIKTGSKLHMKLHGAQLAGYRLLLEDNGFNVRRGMVLQLKKDGTYRCEVADTEFASLQAGFMNCLNLHRYLQKG